MHFCFYLHGNRGLPRAAGLKLHVKLARVLGRAVEKIYGYGGRGSKHPGLAHIYHSLDELEDWRCHVHSSLSIDRCLGAEPPRDLLTLHMAYNQVCTSWELSQSLPFVTKGYSRSPFRQQGKNTCHAAGHVLSRSAERGAEFPTQLRQIRATGPPPAQNLHRSGV